MNPYDYQNAPYQNAPRERELLENERKEAGVLVTWGAYFFCYCVTNSIMPLGCTAKFKPLIKIV
jgi:hypothetical protein